MPKIAATEFFVVVDMIELDGTQQRYLKLVVLFA